MDVALVLFSGSARGLAHIGVIEELEAQGHRITSIAGCSMGGQKRSISKIIIDKLMPTNLDFNYFTLLSRASSIMIRQNSRLMTELMHPDLLIDIELSDIDSFDYDKSEDIIAVGHEKARQALQTYRNGLTGKVK